MKNQMENFDAYVSESVEMNKAEIEKIKEYVNNHKEFYDCEISVKDIVDSIIKAHKAR